VSNLSLDFGDLAVWELELVERHLGLLEHAQEGQLLGQKEEQSATATVDTASRTADTVNVLLLKTKCSA
jgi:hypothetical protein